jgi:tryptophan synthase alpha chain
VGFGISNAAQAKEIGALADGIVIGSAVVKLIDENQNSRNLIKIVSDYTREIKEVLR